MACSRHGLPATRTAVKHNPRRELFGLGMGNLVSGIVGGMPATASLSRTSLNVQSGATHWVSAVINALAVCLICALFFETFATVPIIIIAAILIHLAIRMIHLKEIIATYHQDRYDFTIIILTATMSIFYGPLVGILSGVVAALLIKQIKARHATTR